MLIKESKLRAIIKSILVEETIGSKDAFAAKNKANNNNVNEYIKALENAIKTSFDGEKYEIKVFENDQDDEDQDDEDKTEYILETENFSQLKSFISKEFKTYESVQVMIDSIESMFTSKENKDYNISIKKYKEDEDL